MLILCNEPNCDNNTVGFAPRRNCNDHMKNIVSHIKNVHVCIFDEHLDFLCIKSFIDYSQLRNYLKVTIICFNVMKIVP